MGSTITAKWWERLIQVEFVRFYETPGERITVIDVPGATGPITRAFGINADGQIVGSFSHVSSLGHIALDSILPRGAHTRGWKGSLLYTKGAFRNIVSTPEKVAWAKFHNRVGEGHKVHRCAIVR